MGEVKSPKPTPKKPSGENIPEAQRHTVQVKLRLAPAVADDLRERSMALGCSASDLVSILLEASSLGCENRPKGKTK